MCVRDTGAIEARQQRAHRWRQAGAALALVPALLAAPLLTGGTALAQARHAAHATLPALTNLAADRAQAQKQNLPMLVLVSIEHCPYCEQIRRSHLIPMSRQTNPDVLIREVDLRSQQRVNEGAGKTITQAQWAQRYGARVAPTVLLIGPSGELLAEPLVGASIPDFYGAYLTERIETAKRKLGAS